MHVDKIDPIISINADTLSKGLLLKGGRFFCIQSAKTEAPAGKGGMPRARAYSEGHPFWS